MEILCFKFKIQYSNVVAKHLRWLSPTQLPPSPPPIPHQDTGEVVTLLLLADEVGRKLHDLIHRF